jgi:hypothetical protein
MKNKACHNVDRSAARFGVADGPELCKLVADSIPENVLRGAKRILDVGSGCCGISRAIVKRMVNELYIDEYDAIFRMYGVDTDLALVNRARHLGFVNTVCVDFLEWEPGMRFDVIVGNPPYGKNASLAVKFLNKAVELTDHISYVLPRSFRKPSILNRVNRNLHLTLDEDTPDETFGGTIITCYQKWEVREEKRDLIETQTTHPDFRFVKREEGEMFIGRGGAGPSGKVLTSDFEHYATSHFFVIPKNEEVRERLVSLEPEFRKAARASVVGMPNLSKNELVSIYIQHFG